jgi:predicted dehydrogenase
MLKVLQVGLGSMGKRRIRNLQQLGIKEIIGFDLSEDRREEAKKLYKISTISDIKQGLEEKPNCMIISTPPDLHYKYAKLAIKNDIHFFTEVNLSSKDISKIIQEMKSKKIVGVPSSTMLFHPIIKQLEKLIEKETIGKPLTIYRHFGHYLPNWHPWEDYRKFYVSKKETGAAREVVPFELVWMSYLFSNIYSVYGNINKISNLESNIDDIYQIIIEFTSGIKCIFIVDVISEPAINETRIIGDKGIIYCDHNIGTIKIGKGNKWKEVKIKIGKMAKGYKGNTPADSTYVEEIKNFLDAITKKSLVKHTFENEFKLLKVLDAIEISNKKSKKIIIHK